MGKFGPLARKQKADDKKNAETIANTLPLVPTTLEQLGFEDGGEDDTGGEGNQPVGDTDEPLIPKDTTIPPTAPRKPFYMVEQLKKPITPEPTHLKYQRDV